MNSYPHTIDVPPASAFGACAVALPRARSRQLRSRQFARRILVAALAAATLLALATASPAHASKQVVDFFGGDGTAGGQIASGTGSTRVAVNDATGDIYITDPGKLTPSNGPSADRIHRFHRSDHGTPADPSDDTYEFVSTWGAGVLDGSTDYQVCTDAPACGLGVRSGGNGTAAGNGSLANAWGVAVDPDSGNVYVSDQGVGASTPYPTGFANFRVNVYAADGTFLRSFGWDVVASGPGDTGTGYEICVAAAGDVCKQGVPGPGTGQVGEGTDPNRHTAEGIALSPPDGNPATGAVYLADTANRRINTYGLDGTSPASIGSAAVFGECMPRDVAVDSRGVVYASNGTGAGLCTGPPPNVIERYDSQDANGGGVGFLAPLAVSQIRAVVADPDSDAGGPDADTLYVATESAGVRQYGPANAPGLAAPPAAPDDTHGTSPTVGNVGGLAVEPSTARLYLTGNGLSNGGGVGSGAYVVGAASATPPTATLDSLDSTTHSLTAHATIDPNGAPPTSYRFEYRADAEPDWTTTATVLVGSQDDAQPITQLIDPPVGLAANTLYHVRLVTRRLFSAEVTTPELTASTLPAPPGVETTGTPLRTDSTATLLGRVDPNNSPTDYHFEYGPTTSYGNSTPVRAAGSADADRFVSEPLSGLAPASTYHYRLVADNATGAPTAGEDATATTRSGPDPALEHGPFPGPPGSDRAWELVSLADTSGNPTGGFSGGGRLPPISLDGERATYGVAGGTPIAETGSAFSSYRAERPAGAHPTTGWQSVAIAPPRDQVLSSSLSNDALGAGSDLANVYFANVDFEDPAGVHWELWRLAPDGERTRLFDAAPPRTLGDTLFGLLNGAPAAVLNSLDGSRLVTNAKGGSLDPDFPLAAAQTNFYDVTEGGTPELASLLPGEIAPACGALPAVGGVNLLVNRTAQLSPDGRLLFFSSQGPGPCDDPSTGFNFEGDLPKLYVRDLVAGASSHLSTAPLSGPACPSELLRATPGSLFFATGTRLVPDDVTPANCASGRDIYRYDLGAEGFGDETPICVTCPGPAQASATLNPDVNALIAPDGSRVYFTTADRLDPGAPPGPAIYRAGSGGGDLAYVAPYPADSALGGGALLTEDGSEFSFLSTADLDPSGPAAPTSAGTRQAYRYDDSDRSLLCVSCPPDGSAPLGPAAGNALARQGGNIAFHTTTPLVPADQNTNLGQPFRGTDVYEWRDGRLLLVSDGATSWPNAAYIPNTGTFSASGRDLLFSASARLTPDALDDFQRVYDARIGGGIDLPVEDPPCSLDACQGPPTAPPADDPPGSGDPTGGNISPPDCSKAEAKLAKAEKKLKHAEGKQAKTRARKAVRKAKKQLAACQAGAK